MLDIARYLVVPGTVTPLEGRDPRSTEGFPGGKKEGIADLRDLSDRLRELQELLWAERSRSVLVVLQAMDTGGKDGTIRHVFGPINPQGVEVWSFGVPSALERAHDYLWRVHTRVPARGTIGVFNRSHYEDVLVVRVRSLVPEEVWSKRYEHIRQFERLLTDEGTVIVKLFLHISKDEQRDRMQARIDRPEKSWKYHKDDPADRELWDEFEEAYQVAISETSTEYAPWYVVPADRKWHRNLVVSSILVDTLVRMDPKPPDPEPDVTGIVVT